METLALNSLAIEVLANQAPSPVRLDWRGRSGDRDAAKQVGAYLARVVAQAVAEERAAVEMHFEKLEYFNSATITAIIQMIQDARTKGVRLTLIYDSKLQWQRLSFDALGVFAKDGRLELRPS